MTAPRLVIFDFNGVLYRYDVEVRIRRLAEMTGQLPEAIHAGVWGSGLEDDAEIGAFPDAAAYLDAVNARLGTSLGPAGWIEAIAAALLPIPESIALAQRIASRAVVALLTNNGPIMKDAIRAVDPALAELFGDRLHTSSDFGVRKPDPAVYRRLAGQLGFRPDEAFFIDDAAGHAAGARKGGLAAHHFRSAAGLAAALEEAGLDLG